MTTPRLVLGLLAAAVARAGAPSHRAAHPVGPQACQACHEPIVGTFVQTAHFRTSAEASARTVKGRFSEGHNLLRTRSPGVYFVMEHRADGFYETGIASASGTTRTERIDLVVGSGRRGQSYLYWRNGLLFELPVSYLTGVAEWINSPGYPDGQIDFGRLIVPRCLECHSTSFTLRVDRGTARYSGNYALGISCETCHDDGRAHVEYHSAHPGETQGRYIVNPARLATARQVDNCGLCHSGARDARRPAFSYRPGEVLDDYFLPATGGDQLVPDVHGNQVGLLQRSKCFRARPDMSCATCHDVHRPQRDVAWFARKCLACHETTRHPMADRIGGRLIADCIDCHMPNRTSHALEFNTPTNQVALHFRSHAIGIYPDVTAALLGSNRGKEQR